MGNWEDTDVEDDFRAWFEDRLRRVFPLRQGYGATREDEDDSPAPPPDSGLIRNYFWSGSEHFRLQH